MKKISLMLMLVLILSTVILVACGGGDESSSTPAPANTANSGQAAPATSQPGQEPGVPSGSTTGEIPKPGEVTPVNFNDLLPFVPDAPSGWTLDDDPSGMSMSMQGYSYSLAEGDYTNSSTDEYASVSIYDSAYYYGFGWMQLYESDFEYQSSDGYAKSITFNGRKAFETYDKPDSYDRMIMVGDRFMVVVSTETKDSLELFSNAIDYDGLDKLT